MTKSLKKIIKVALTLLVAACSGPKQEQAATETTNAPDLQLETLQRAFAEHRFGGFIHFGIMTFTGDPWATPHQDISQFNPGQLDCRQWAQAFKSAGMEFAIFTTRHHDGFALWDSQYSTFDVANTPWQAGKGDVVREFVDSFRAEGISPCLYYSIWDSTAGIGEGPVTEAQMQTVKGQLTELLTNYGPIEMLFLDGWSWKMGQLVIPYEEIHGLIKQLQPNCLVVDNTHLKSLFNQEVLHYEAGSGLPKGNTQPAILSLLINEGVGNDWFWDPRVPQHELLSVERLVNETMKTLEPQWITFVLNCPPNQQGLMDENIVKRLAEVGAAWQMDSTRAPLPAQQQQIYHPVSPVSATATSGEAHLAIDAFNDRYNYTVWQSDTLLPQTLTIDYGRVRDSLSILTYLPKYVPYIDPKTEGSVTQYAVYLSEDGAKYVRVAAGNWTGDTAMKTVTFAPRSARYVKFEVLAANEGFAAATEVMLGAGSYSTYDFPELPQ